MPIDYESCADDSAPAGRAEAGIEHYVVVDPTVAPVRTDVFRLVRGRYEQGGEPMSGMFTLTEPFEVAVKLD